MSGTESKILRALGAYRAAETLYSIWVGKSLLAAAIISIAAPVLALLSNEFSWERASGVVFNAVSIYAFFVVGILATILAQERISPKNKLSLEAVSFGCDVVSGSKPLEATAFSASVYFVNVGNFPISYVVREIDFRIGSNVLGEPAKNRGDQIDVGQRTSYHSGPVIFHAPVRLPVEGQFTLKWSYGKHGKEKFGRELRLWVKFRPDPQDATKFLSEWRSLPAS